MRAWLFLTAILLAQAAAAAPLGLEAQTVATSDAARLEGTVSAFLANGTGTAPTGTLAIDAPRLGVHVQGLRDETALLGGTSDATAYEDDAEFAPARLQATRLGAWTDILVQPSGPDPVTAVVQTVGAALARPATPTLAPRDYVAGDEPEALQLDGSLAATTGSAVTVTLTGSFTVRLWDVDVRVDGGGGPRDFVSGERYEEAAPGPAGVRVLGTMEASELVLTVASGTLRLELAGLAPALVVSPGIDLQVRGAVVLAGARGLPDVAASTLEVRGDLLLVAQPAGAGLAVALDGAIDEARADGEPLALVLPGDAQGMSWWLLVLPVVLLAAAAGGRRIAVDRRMAHLRDAMARNDHAAAARTFGPLLRTRRHRADALFLGTLALARLERAQEAQRLLRKERLWRRNAPGIRLFLLAYTQALLGQDVAARQTLGASLREAPALRSEARENPLLAPLLGQGPPAGDGYS